MGETIQAICRGWGILAEKYTPQRSVCWKIQKWEGCSVVWDSEGWLDSRVCHSMYEFVGWGQQATPAGGEV